MGMCCQDLPKPAAYTTGGISVAQNKPSKGRKVEAEIEINSSPERIWRAITEAKELMRWFPLSAEVEPGEGGKVIFSWGDLYPGEEAVIEKWLPESRLRIVYGQAATGEMGMPDDSQDAEVMAVDYHIESKGGKTVLRVIHSGFGTDDQWDEWYDGTVRGWQFELRSLRNYLDHHYGRDRDVIWLHRPIINDVETAWRKLIGENGFRLEEILSTAKAGDRYTSTAASGDEFRGIIQIVDQPWQFSGTIENLDNALLRLTLDPSPQGTLASVFINTYGIAGNQLKALEEQLDTMMSTLFD